MMGGMQMQMVARSYLVYEIPMLVLSLFGGAAADRFNKKQVIHLCQGIAMILEVVDEGYRGRVSSVYTLNFSLVPIGILTASIISQYCGVQPATATMGILLLVICLVLLATQ